MESALLMTTKSQRRVLPAQRRGREAYRGDSSVITASEGESSLRLGDPAPIALPSLREGAFLLSILKSW